MAKKRKANRNSEPSGARDTDPKDARLGPISTYEDVADSEDEFHINRDRLMLEDEPASKRQKKALDDIEMSDEEVLGYSDESESDDDDKVTLKKLAKNAKLTKGAQSDSEQEEVGEEEGDEGWWGSSKNEYYNADNIETEAEALAEEQEAKRIQQKKYSKMTDEDFMFDGDAWAAPEDEEREGDAPVTEVLQELEVTDDMGPEERYRMLKSRYPEFEHLVTELQEQQPVLESLRAEAKAKGTQSVEAVKYWVLGCYVSALASYFALLTSPARDSSKEEKPLNPSDLRDHEIMETLVTCREAWRRIQDLKSTSSGHDEEEAPLVPDEIEEPDGTVEKKKKKKSKKADKGAALGKRAKKTPKGTSLEDELAGLYNEVKSSKKHRNKIEEESDSDADSDFGDKQSLSARAAADKAARKKTLSFYTSQLSQTANRRAGAGRQAGGDEDVPHRERLRDRQARLLKEAERRGTKSAKGADLDSASEDEDTATAKDIRNDEDEYYDMVAHKAKKHKEEKNARFAAFAAASKADRVVENEEIGEDGKRKITYAIEKNKGLTPRRKKDVRNPRVKKKKQYEAKQKKLSSMKPVWKGGEPKGGYRGELSGINTGVVKSVKL